MNYLEIQQYRRDVLSGRICAPEYPRVDPRSARKVRSDSNVFKRKAQEIVNYDNDGWHEEAFQDDFYGGEQEDDNVDVVPGYFHNCKQLITNFSRDKNMDGVANNPLFRGSIYTAKDLARFLLSFKARHLKVGDGILANVVAMMATFLPDENLFKEWLPKKTSTYLLLKTLDNLASFKTNMRCIKIDCCVKKCMGFYAENAGLDFCSICKECRWKLCTAACFTNGEKICDHDQPPRQSIYYNVVQDRLVKLLKSDLKKLFNYQHNRAGIYVWH